VGIHLKKKKKKKKYNDNIKNLEKYKTRFVVKRIIIQNRRCRLQFNFLPPTLSIKSLRTNPSYYLFIQLKYPIIKC